MPFSRCAAALANHAQPSVVFSTRSTGIPVISVASAADRSAHASRAGSAAVVPAAVAGLLGAGFALV